MYTHGCGDHLAGDLCAGRKGTQQKVSRTSGGPRTPNATVGFGPEQIGAISFYESGIYELAGENPALSDLKPAASRILPAPSALADVT